MIKFYLFGVFIGFFVVGLPVPSAAHGRQPPPIVREADFSGQPALSLKDVTQIMGGQLHEYPVSQRVDLSFSSHEVQFFIGSDKAVVDNQSISLSASSVKDSRGIWVPKSFFTSGPLSRDFRKQIELGPAEALMPTVVPVVKPATVDKKSLPAALPGEHPKETQTLQPKVTEPAAAEPEEPAPIAHAIKRIVIDPGHGGKDPGAVSIHGIEEKTVNLWMAEELADALRDKDFEVLLTRTDDTFIPLAARAALANKYKADLFISVHCNASLSSKMNGFEVYFLSEKASNPHADAVARKENASLEFEGKSPSTPVQAVLQSLVKNANINRSAQLGGIIEREVAQQLSQTDLGVKQAAFYVLRGAQMPAVLIELGFLTHQGEEKLLENPDYRRRLIHAIETSIVDFDRKQQEAGKTGEWGNQRVKQFAYWGL